jgi:acetoin utilization protein AcuB
MSATNIESARTSNALENPFVIRHWMTASPHSIGRDQPLAVAHRLMREHDLRHLPVLERGKIVGVVSQRDLYFLETIGAVDPETEYVDEAMTADVYCVSPTARVEEVVAEMATHKYGCAIVIENSKTIGVFTTTDALRLLARILSKKS